MKQIFFVALALMSFASCSEAQEGTKENGVVNKVVAAKEFNDMIADDVQLIDVRTPGEVSGGKIANATNIDYNGANFEEELKKLDMNKRTLVYCAVGGRSGRAAKIMKDLGFKEVYDLKGGYNGWPYK